MHHNPGETTNWVPSVLSDVQEKSGGGFLDNIRALPDEGMAEAGPASTSEGPSVAGGDPQQGRGMLEVAGARLRAGLPVGWHCGPDLSLHPDLSC